MSYIQSHPKFRYDLIPIALLGILSVILYGASFLRAGEPLRFDDRVPMAVEEIPDNSLLNRNTLLGDWAGLRPALEKQGITWDLSYTGVYAGVFEGGVRDKSFDWGHRYDAFIRADTGRMGLWDGGRFHFHLESRYGESTRRLVSRTGGLWPANSSATLPLGEPGRLAASSIYYSHGVGDRGSLILGKINALDLLAGDPFFGGSGRTRFSNLAFTAPPSGVVPPVIMGAAYTHRADSLTYTFMVFDPNDWTNDYWPSGFFDEGVNLSLGVTWSGDIGGRKSSLGVTGTYSTQEGVDLRDLVLPPGLVAGKKEGAYNIALNASHLFWESPDHPGKGLGIYAKVAIADGNPNPIQSSVIGGIAAYGLCPRRPDDVLGIGYYHYDFSEDLRSGVAPLVPFGPETGVEVFYNLAVTPWFHLTADVQWIQPVRENLPDSWVGGLRGSIDF